MFKIFFILLFFYQSASAVTFEKKQLNFDNGKKLTVEIADDYLKREQGLMNRTSLAEGDGMLFIFPRSQGLSFWMKDTFIPLSIGYFDKDKTLKEIYEMQPQNMLEKHQNLKSYPSQCQCMYALEVPQGWFKKNKVKIGARFKLKPSSSPNSKKISK